MKHIILIFGLLCGYGSVAAQSLSTAATQQLEANIRNLLIDYFQVTRAYVKNPSEAEAQEQLNSRLLLYGQSPQTVVFNDVSPELSLSTTFAEYFAKLRGKYGNNPAAFVCELSEASLKHTPPKVIGDSVVVEVFFNKTIAASQTIALSMVFTGRMAQDAQSKYPYFKRLKIAGSKKATAPAVAVAFAPAQVNPYQTFLNEQSLSTVLARVSASLLAALPAQAKSVYVSRFSYAGCGIYDAFARSVSVTVSTKLMAARENISFTTEDPQQASYEIRGQYQTNGENLSITAEIFDINGKRIAQVSNSDLPLKWFDANQVGFIPADYQRTAAEQRVISQNMVSNSENLSIQLSTNKGRRGLLFKDGEPMDFYITANRPCKVRLLYRDVLQRLISIKDQEITLADIGRMILIERFACVNPFGRESLVCIATTDHFGNLTIINEKIIDEQGGELNIPLIQETYDQAIKILKNPPVRSTGKRTDPNSTPTTALDKLEIQTVEK